MNNLDFITGFIQQQNKQASPPKRMLQGELPTIESPSAPVVSPVMVESEEKNTIINFLKRLILLDAIPLNYIIPHPNLLPDESIRFFTVDMEWLNHLMKGALSIGAANEFDEAIDQWVAGILKSNAVSDSVQYIPDRLGHLKAFLPQDQKDFLASLQDQQVMPKTATAAPSNTGDDFIYTKKLSGFVMRSSFVEKWPGVRVDAYEGANMVPILNSIVIDNHIKICLYEGLCTQFSFYENTGSLTFGFDMGEGQYSKKIRNAPDASTGEGQKSLPICYRESTGQSDGVVDITAMAAGLKRETGLQKELDASDFAYYMLQGANNVAFNLT